MNSIEGSSNSNCIPVRAYQGDKWTPLLVLAAVVSTFGFAVPAGYCLGVLNTPVKILQTWCNQTLVETRDVILTKAQFEVMWSLIVSVFLIGGVIGGLIGAWFADHMGRRGTLVFGNVLNVISGCLFIASKFVPSVEMFFVARIISGFTAGLMTTVVPMYLNELSPPLLTGLMGMLFPTGLTIGILTSQIAGLDFLLGTERLWPYLVSGYILMTLLVFASLPVLPESPKYLHGISNEQEKALEQLTRLRNLPRDVVAWEIASVPGSPRHSIQEKWSLLRVLTTPRLRIPLCLVVALQAGQQFSGINAVFYYSANIFETAGLNKESIPYANIGTGFINFAVTACGMCLVNRFGRRPLLVVSCSMTSLALILLASSSKYMDYASWVPSLSVFYVLAFVFMYDLGLGPIPFFIGAELVDIGPRPTVMALGSVANYGANFLVAIGYTSVHNCLHEWIFTCFAASTFLLMVFVA